MLSYSIFLFLLAGGVASQSYNTAGSQNQTYVLQEIGKISKCGLSCLSFTIPQVGCTLVDTKCQCESAKLESTASACMYANCTLEENLSLAKIQAAICERPNDSKANLLKIMTITCTTFTNTVVALRLASRLFPQRNLGLDDLAITIAAISDGIFTYYGVLFERNGFGEHIWNIEASRLLDLLFWFYICEIFYVATIGIIKMSILFFYLRVFPKKSFRIWCWTVIQFCLATTVVFVLVLIFQCHPVSYVWDKDIRPGKCISYNTVSWAHAGINILQDIVILLLPIGELHSLNLGWTKRLSLYAMFGVGSCVCVLSMVRLNSLKKFGLTADPTYDNVSTTFWSTLETTTAFVAACIPAIRAGSVNLFHKAAELTTGNSSNNQLTRPSVCANRRGQILRATGEWGEITATYEISVRSEKTDIESMSGVSKIPARRASRPPPIDISRVRSECFHFSEGQGYTASMATKLATTNDKFHLDFAPMPESSPRSLYGIRLPRTSTFRQLSKSLPPSPFSICAISPQPQRSKSSL